LPTPPTGEQNQKKRTDDVLPKPDKIIRSRHLPGAIRDARNRRAGAPRWVFIMCTGRGSRADSGLRPRRRSCDRAVAPGAAPRSH
jgi:hypothetical protein